MCVLLLPAEDEGWQAGVVVCYLLFVSCYVWDSAICPCVYFMAPASPVFAFLSGCTAVVVLRGFMYQTECCC